MADLQSFEKQDLINLQKYVDVQKKSDAAYETKDGTIRSAYVREETVYRLKVKGSNEIHMFVFNKFNKPVDHFVETIEDREVV